MVYLLLGIITSHYIHSNCSDTVCASHKLFLSFRPAEVCLCHAD